MKERKIMIKKAQLLLALCPRGQSVNIGREITFDTVIISKRKSL